MSREEEKQEKAMEIAKKHMSFCGLPITECIDAALEMADWVDQHPRKGLWDSEKVIEWLKVYTDDYFVRDTDDPWLREDDFIRDLRKAMED